MLEHCFHVTLQYPFTHCGPSAEVVPDQIPGTFTKWKHKKDAESRMEWSVAGTMQWKRGTAELLMWLPSISSLHGPAAWQAD